MMGLMGEGIVDERTWIVAGHHPFLLQGAIKYTSNKVIVLVRNPLDVLPSYASMCNTLNHSAKPEFEYEEAYPEWWDWFVRRQIKNMRDYFKVALRHCTADGKNPMYICRFEDMITNPKEVLMGLFAFLLDVDDLSGTNCEKRIDEIVALGHGASVIYKLKPTTGKFNQHAQRYTADQLDYIKETMAEQLYFFGYTNHPEIEHDTAFFDYGDDHKPDHLSDFKGYLKVNEESLKEVSSKDRPIKEYKVNTDVFMDVLQPEDLERIQDPCKDYARKVLAQGP